MEEETKDKKNLLHLSHIITVYNINIRIGITLKRKLRNQNGFFFWTGHVACTCAYNAHCVHSRAVQEAWTVLSTQSDTDDEATTGDWCPMINPGSMQKVVSWFPRCARLADRIRACLLACPACLWTISSLAVAAIAIRQEANRHGQPRSPCGVGQLVWACLGRLPTWPIYNTYEIVPNK